jgi:hypothetical protein
MTTMPQWISDTIGALMAWMIDAGVTEIVITQEGATWGIEAPPVKWGVTSIEDERDAG